MKLVLRSYSVSLNRARSQSDLTRTAALGNRLARTAALGLRSVLALLRR